MNTFWSIKGNNHGSIVITALTYRGKDDPIYKAVVPPRPWPIEIKLLSKVFVSKFGMHSLSKSGIQSTRFIISCLLIANLTAIRFVSLMSKFLKYLDYPAGFLKCKAV